MKKAAFIAAGVALVIAGLYLYIALENIFLAALVITGGLGLIFFDRFSGRAPERESETADAPAEPADAASPGSHTSSAADTIPTVDLSNAPRYAAPVPARFPSAVPRSRFIAIMLSIVGGVVGLDRFYLGLYGSGILKACTLGGGGIWILIDVFFHATGVIQPGEGYCWDSAYRAAEAAARDAALMRDALSALSDAETLREAGELTFDEYRTLRERLKRYLF